jgi:hypothetical protein
VAPPIRQSDTIDLTCDSPPVIFQGCCYHTTAGAIATPWLNLKEKRKGPISLKELYNADELPIILGLDNNNISNKRGCGILVKVETQTTMAWKVMNATKTTELCTISWDRDHGLEANWGLWYKDPFDDVQTTCIAAAKK